MSGMNAGVVLVVLMILDRSGAAQGMTAHTTGVSP
jgi:hypothetical protein